MTGVASAAGARRCYFAEARDQGKYPPLKRGGGIYSLGPPRRFSGSSDITLFGFILWRGGIAASAQAIEVFLAVDIAPDRAPTLFSVANSATRPIALSRIGIFWPPATAKRIRNPQETQQRQGVQHDCPE